MTDIDKTLVEEYVKTKLTEKAEIILLATVANRSLNPMAPKYLTILEVQDKVTGLRDKVSFNSLKILRQLKKQEKYGSKN